ncbi:MAG TPA: ABC transporter permease [Streptosporangiaceae bacterium]|nr:ABC transporter permease [Streptosporangiaceae bacterium]
MTFLSYAWNWLTAGQQWQGSDGIPLRVLQHLGYSALALLIAALVALPLGVAIGHVRRGAFAVVSVANFWRAIPTLGLLIMMVVWLGFSPLTWLIPLVALAIPPILVNSYEGVLGVDPDLTDAGAGMGMTGWQVLWRIEIPVALPLIMLGLRTAAIFIVATATIAAEIGTGGLGRYIIDGLAANDYGQVAGGGALVVLLALGVQVSFVGLRRLVVPAGLRKAGSS